MIKIHKNLLFWALLWFFLSLFSTIITYERVYPDNLYHAPDEGVLVSLYSEENSMLGWFSILSVVFFPTTLTYFIVGVPESFFFSSMLLHHLVSIPLYLVFSLVFYRIIIGLSFRKKKPFRRAKAKKEVGSKVSIKVKFRNRIVLLFSRYAILLLLAVNGLALFYYVLTPLTVYSVFFIIKIFYSSAFLDGVSIMLSGYSVDIVEACVAGSAYYLLLVLNLATPMQRVITRVYSLLFSMAVLFLLNIMRIVFFSFLLLVNFKIFTVLHLIFWYVLSVLFVFLVWVLTIRLFKVENIPFYSDLKLIKKA